MCREGQENARQRFEKHQGQSVLICSGTPEKLHSSPRTVTEWEGAIDKCCSMRQQFVCAPARFLMLRCRHRTQIRLGTRREVQLPPPPMFHISVFTPRSSRSRAAHNTFRIVLSFNIFLLFTPPPLKKELNANLPG